MVDDRPEDTGSLPDSGRPKRAPPTIDLEATEVSETKAADIAERAEPKPEPAPEAPAAGAAGRRSRRLRAGFSLGRRADLRRGRGGAGDRRRLDAGLAAVQLRRAAAPQVNAAAIDALTARVAGLEAEGGKPPRVRSRRCRAHRGAGKIARALRGELAATRAQGGQARVRRQRRQSRAARRRAPRADLSAINERIAQIERASATQGAEIAQQGGKIADAKADAKPADDVPLRRVVAASLLDVPVRIGDPYAAALAAAKALAPNAER